MSLTLLGSSMKKICVKENTQTTKRKMNEKCYKALIDKLQELVNVEEARRLRIIIFLDTAISS